MGLVACSEKEVPYSLGDYARICEEACEEEYYPEPEPEPCEDLCPANSVNGYWRGYGTDEDGNTFNVEAIFVDGKFISLDADSIVSGKYTIDNGELSSMDTKVYEMNGPYVDNIQINSNQTVYGESRITADVVLADENSTLDIGYEAFSETTISYSDFTGRWVLFYDKGAPSSANFDEQRTFISSANFDEQGTFISVVDKCTISGSISIPTTNFFIFDVEVTIAGDECLVKGSYDGLGAFFEDQVNMANTVNMFYTNDVFGLNFNFAR